MMSLISLIVVFIVFRGILCVYGYKTRQRNKIRLKGKQAQDKN